MVKNIVKAIMLLILFTTSMQAASWRSYLPKLDIKNTIINGSKNISELAQSTTGMKTIAASCLLSTLGASYCAFKCYSADDKNKSNRFAWAKGAAVFFLTALGSMALINNNAVKI